MSQAGDISAIIGPVPPNVPTQFTTDSGVAVPAANNLNVFGGSGATTSGSGSTITVTVTNSGFSWSDQAVTFNAQVENGYFCTAALTVNLPLQAGLSIGNTIIIYVDTASAVTIQANTGEFIQVGANISVSGGIAVSNTRGAILTLVYRPTDTTWHSITSFGSWSVT